MSKRKEKSESNVSEKKLNIDTNIAKCTVCYNFKTVAMSNGCEHSLCITCAMNLSESICPMCRHQQSYSRNYAVEALIRDMGVENNFQTELASRLELLNMISRNELMYISSITFHDSTANDVIEFVKLVDSASDHGRHDFWKTVEIMIPRYPVIVSRDTSLLHDLARLRLCKFTVKYRDTSGDDRVICLYLPKRTGPKCELPVFHRGIDFALE